MRLSPKKLNVCTHQKVECICQNLTNIIANITQFYDSILISGSVYKKEIPKMFVTGNMANKYYL